VPYEITVDTARELVRVLVSGVFDAEEAPRMSTDARRIASEHQLHRILYDVRVARAGKLENSDLFWLPRNVPALKDPRAPRVRVATLFVEPQRPIVEFWENAFRNLGLSARGFLEEDAALDWLAG
jgi:hypothetical protein